MGERGNRAGSWRRLLAVVPAVAVLASAGGSEGFAQDETISAPSCSYWNDDTNKSATGPCKLRSTKIKDSFAYVLTFGDGTRVTIEYVASQGGYHRWNINGRPGFGVELSRDSLRGATLDLKQTVDWDTSPPPKRSR